MTILQRSGRAGGPIVRTIIKHPWLAVATAAGMVGLGAALVVSSGVIPINASSGHWAITNWLLDFAKVRSVTTHSLGIEAPSLDDPTLIVRGAAHYEIGCAPCHGGLEGVIPPVMAAMTPAPPELPKHVARWDAEELFSIVKDGIKFTGMPGWAVRGRDDEVWAVVAFLQRMPTLTAAEYRTLAYGDRADGETVLTSTPAPRAVREICSRCHGMDGLGRRGAFPALAGQRTEYLYRTLRAFADRRRASGIMQPVAVTLTDQDMRAAAAYFQALPSRPPDVGSDTSSVERGAAIATNGIPDRDVPACRRCHGPGDGPKNPGYPQLAGQYARYLISQLDLFGARRRGGSGYETLMHAFVNRLEPDEIRDVARYFSAQRGAVITPSPARASRLR
jgi:cytochrome c553